MQFSMRRIRRMIAQRTAHRKTGKRAGQGRSVLTCRSMSSIPTPGAGQDRGSRHSSSAAPPASRHRKSVASSVTCVT